MSEDLYFLPLIQQALLAADPKTAMARAFRQIRALGRRPEYHRGWRQFLRFMENAWDAREEEAGNQASAPPAATTRPQRAELVLESGSVPSARCALPAGAGTWLSCDVDPGDYCLKLDTGRVLWERRLEAEHVLWTRAFPGVPLQAAADTGGQRRRPPALRETLLGGVLILRVYPGLERGRLEIECNTEGPAPK